MPEDKRTDDAKDILSALEEIISSTRDAVAPPPPPPPPPAAAPVETVMEARPAPPKVVMVIDDDPDVRILLDHNVRKAGLRAVTAADWRDADAKLAQTPPDLILLDLMLPGRNGYEILRELRAAGHERIPVAIVTARSLDSSTVALLLQEPNVVDFFAKPLDMPRLTDFLRRRLGGSSPSPRQGRRGGGLPSDN
ncbi:MAG: response regulator transcription factor [Elusimicrobia bacterium]|nr:response regulator transcription factor [Elusimicrobiota bacterium]